MRYGLRSSISCCRLIPRVRRVRSRTCVLNLSRAFGAMRRSLPSFEMLNPRNLRSEWLRRLLDVRPGLTVAMYMREASTSAPPEIGPFSRTGFAGLDCQRGEAFLLLRSIAPAEFPGVSPDVA